MHTLFLIDDHKIVRDGIKAMLLARPDIKVVGEAGSAEEARQKIKTLNPDFVFVDLKLPDTKGSLLIEELFNLIPTAKFALLTADPNAQDLKRAQEAGTLAFLTKDMDTNQYFEAIDKMVLGKRFISPSFSQVLINADEQFTPRELEVLEGFSQGLSYKEIGAQLGMSPRTVETHKNSLLQKMGVKSIVEMVRKAIRDGYITA